MDSEYTFGQWVRYRRRILDMTQADLARTVHCSLSMLRKIERDERRPSKTLADLLADSLAVDSVHRSQFMQMARGRILADLSVSSDVEATRSPVALTEQQQGQVTFVGRQVELQRLHSALRCAIEVDGNVVFVCGEAGRGKTSLLYEFARQAVEMDPDLLIAYGASDVYTGAGDPLLPFRDIFRQLTGDFDSAVVRSIDGGNLAARLNLAMPSMTEALLDHGPNLIETIVSGVMLEDRLSEFHADNKYGADLLAHLRTRRSRFTLRSPQDLPQERLFDEIAMTLNALARRHPLLLLLDDLHWMDTSTASLLGHLSTRVQHNRILILGSYRPEDLAQNQLSNDSLESMYHPLQDVLNGSRRLYGDNQIDLDHPLNGTESAFVNAMLDEEPNRFDETFRRHLAHITQGNALFIAELLRDMKERGDVQQDDSGIWLTSDMLSWEHIPARLEGVIGTRISRLSNEQRYVLQIASVHGEFFFGEVIARVRQADERATTRLLDKEIDNRHRLIREVGVQRLGDHPLTQYRFRHQLFQTYLYEHLSMAERMYLHEDVGSALESLLLDRVETQDLPAVQLARHFEEAHLTVKASRYRLYAGQNAMRVRAFNQATMHFEHGLSLLQHEEKTTEVGNLQFDTTLDLAHAHWHAGRIAQASSTYVDAIELARSLGAPEALARAVLAYEEPRWRLDQATESSLNYLNEALSVLGDQDSGYRVRLLVRLARAMLGTAEPSQLRDIVDTALELARRVDDPIALCDALHTSAQLDRDPSAATKRLAILEELIATAKTIDDAERLADAYDIVVYEQVGLGNIQLLDRAMAEQKRIAEEIRQPFQLHIASVFQAMRSILEGDFATAEKSAIEASTISQQLGIADRDGIYGLHMFTIRSEQGRLGQIAPIVQHFVASNPDSLTWLPGLARIYAFLGDRENCAGAFETLASNAFAQIPRDSMWVTSLAYMTEVAVFLVDVERAAILYQFLLPYDGQTVVAGLATVCHGAVGRYLGMLATIIEDWPAAQHHFDGALALDAQMGARPWLAHSQYEYARMYLARKHDGDRARAAVLLDQSLCAAQSMEMAHLIEQIDRARRQHKPA